MTMEKEMESSKPGVWPLPIYESIKKLFLYMACKHKMESKYLEKRNMYVVLRV